MKRETESLIFSVQNQSIRTNLVEPKKEADESIDHVVSGCSKLVQKEYKIRHDNLGKVIHWKLARKCNFEAGGKWYEHEPESILENEDYK